MLWVSTPYSRGWFYEIYMESFKKKGPMLKVKLLDPKAKAPTVAHPGEDLAYDLYALEDTKVRVWGGRTAKIRTGIAAVFEENPYSHLPYRVVYGLLIRDRSSLAAAGLAVTGGVVDAGYRGEIVVVMNFVSPPFDESTGMLRVVHEFKTGDKVAQMIPIPVMTQQGVSVVDDLPASERGEAGFGSTGR